MDAPGKIARKHNYSDHIEQTIALAQAEVTALLRERRMLNQRLRKIKRTVDGLTSLFDEEVVSKQLSSARSLQNQVNETDSVSSVEQPASTPGRIQKLERACRIALLETEEAATTEEVYDRISRRRSYNLRRLKHPLALIIAILENFVACEDVRVEVEEGTRRWQWNRAAGRQSPVAPTGETIAPCTQTFSQPDWNAIPPEESGPSNLDESP